MNEYQQEQWQAACQIIDRADFLDAIQHGRTVSEIKSYIEFRNTLETFQNQYFGSFCTRKCFENQKSSCCSKDGIVTFWADHVINYYCSTRNQVDDLTKAIQTPHYSNKCIYLGPNGCVWKIPPLGCALFLCDPARQDVFEKQCELKNIWAQFEAKAKAYRWPDRPVLFDSLEQIYMADGCHSPLMYINTSPGLLRIKQKSKTGVTQGSFKKKNHILI